MWAMTISRKSPITRLRKTEVIMMREATPTFLDKDPVIKIVVTDEAQTDETGGRLEASFWHFKVFVFNLKYQKVIDKAKDYKAKTFWKYTFGR